MSIERDLLKEALKVLEWNGMDSHHTYNSIKELLAQPELSTDSLQLDDEKPANITTVINNIFKVGNGEPPTTDGDPDVYTLSPMTHREAYLRGYEKAVCALKREPLSDLRIRAANRNEYFEWGVRFAEKAHGIGGEE